jgi:uncharacterized protein YdcH (DUF465 family)
MENPAKILEETVSKRLKVFEPQKAELNAKLNELLENAEKLLERLNQMKIEIAECEDSDMPARKSRADELRKEALALSPELEIMIEMHDHIAAILEEIKIKIESLQRLNPGEEYKN